MKISLFSRILLFYLFIMIAIVISTFSVFRYYYWHNSIDQNKNKLSNDLIYFQKHISIWDETFKENTLSLYSESNNSVIIISDKDGNTLDLYGNPTLKDKKVLTDKALIKSISNVQDNKVFFDDFDKFDNKMIIVSGSIKYKNNVHKLLIFYNTSLLEKYVPNIYGLLIIPIILLIILGVMLILWFNFKLTYPLSQLNLLAKEVSKGKYNKRITRISSDEMGQLSIAFNQMVEGLSNLDCLRKEFIASVTHELRSPLTSIGGFIQGMLDGTVPEKDKNHYLNIALYETKRLSSLIDQLLDIAKLESGKFELNKKSFDINELIRRVLISFEKRINEKFLEVDVLLPDEKLKVYADIERIQQVIFNLLDNAVKFSPVNGILKIKVNLDINKIKVTISDQGPGISDEDQNLIWNMFYAGNKSHTSGTGYGLGLSIIKAIIEQHNQEIILNSILGEGTTIVFTLDKDEIL